MKVDDSSFGVHRRCVAKKGPSMSGGDATDVSGRP